jgi:thiaminase
MIQSSEERVSERATEHCSRALGRSRFFGLLKGGGMPAPLLKYAFLQYRFFRDQLHRWFALCIIKVASGADLRQRDAVMALASHIFTDLRDGHDLMFTEFLQGLGIGVDELATSRASPATIAYTESFFDDFGYEPNNFYEALAALSGRELCVAIRNERIIREYFAPRGTKPPTWLALHAELELDHFHDAVRPALAHCGDDDEAIASLTTAIERGIDRHVDYFEGLLREYQAA